VGPSASLDAVVKRKIPDPARNRTSFFPLKVFVVFNNLNLHCHVSNENVMCMDFRIFFYCSTVLVTLGSADM
jgi:hypothetical protein